MVEFPVTTIQISGYTDGLGTDAYNKVLSDKRAKACADYLIQKGIDASRVSFVSFRRLLSCRNGKDQWA